MAKNYNSKHSNSDEYDEEYDSEERPEEDGSLENCNKPYDKDHDEDEEGCDNHYKHCDDDEDEECEEHKKCCCQGPQGPQGPRGKRGEQGPQGEEGPRGKKGDKGETGEEGPQGPQGKIGPQGKTGSQGPQGKTGPQGEKGEKGQKGDKGETGEEGPQGPQGKIGPQGKTGAQGPQGEKGEKGQKGDKGEPGAQGEQGPPGASTCECCLASLRAVLQYLKSSNANDIRVETIAQQPAVNNRSIVAFIPVVSGQPDNASQALLVQFSDGTIVSICNIEVIRSSKLIDPSTGNIAKALKALLDETIAHIPSQCEKCCSEQLRKLFNDKINKTVSNIDTHANNRISGQNNKVRGTGAGSAIISLNNDKDGAAVNLCYVSSVNF